MANLKLNINEFDEVDYELIAIHTSLEAYRLAYFLNQKLPILLSKNQSEVQIKQKEGEAYFIRYFYENKETNTTWDLIENKSEILIHKTNNTNDLFTAMNLTTVKKTFLITELKKADYLLKIEDNSFHIQDIVNTIQTINRIEAVYIIDTTQIKSKNNLIL